MELRGVKKGFSEALKFLDSWQLSCLSHSMLQGQGRVCGLELAFHIRKKDSLNVV